MCMETYIDFPLNPLKMNCRIYQLKLNFVSLQFIMIASKCFITTMRSYNVTCNVFLHVLSWRRHSVNYRVHCRKSKGAKKFHSIILAEILPR